MKTKLYLSLISAVLFSFLSVSLAKSTTISRSENETRLCKNSQCLSTVKKSNLLKLCQEMSQNAGWAQDWKCKNTAIYDDGNDRKILYELRKKHPDALSVEAKAILSAANKYGNVVFCAKSGGNASLIRYNGRPAIVTSAHMLYDSKTDKQKCSAKELRSAAFMPNTSYFNDVDSKYSESFTHIKVGLEIPPISTKRSKIGSIIAPQDDFVIFYLRKDISKDIMPDGKVRGVMEFATGKPTDSGKLYMIGIASDIKNGLETLYQICDFKSLRIVGIKHNCDTVAGSSGSMLSVMQDGELKIRGIHAASKDYDDLVPATQDPHEWNFATDFVGNRNISFD